MASPLPPGGSVSPWRLDDHGGQEGRLALRQLLATPLVDQAVSHIEMTRDGRHDRTRREHRLQDLQPLRIAPPTRRWGPVITVTWTMLCSYERS